ncbi:MAG: myxosortase family intramembrane protease [Myxococcota bacterium]
MSEPAPFVAGEPTGEPAWRILLEVLGLWLGVNGVIWGARLVYEATKGMGSGWQLVLAVVPILFMYVPVLVCKWRGVDSWAYPLALPALRDWKVWKPVLKWNAIFIGVIVVPFVAGYHVWHVHILQDVRIEAGFPVLWPTIGSTLLLIGYHLFFVAIPEEFFYRGYLQTRLDELFGRKWSVFGTLVGPGLLIATVIFAFGHTLVVYQWWHVFIIGPGLIFGWLRARTGDVMAGAFFHAWCNVTVTTLDVMYGLQSLQGG